MKLFKLMLPLSIVGVATSTNANEYRVEYMHTDNEHQYVLGVDSGHNLLRFGAELEQADDHLTTTGNIGVNIAGPFDLVVKPRIEAGFDDDGRVVMGTKITAERPFNRFLIGEVSYRYRAAETESSRWSIGARIPISYNVALSTRYITDTGNYDGVQLGINVRF